MRGWRIQSDFNEISRPAGLRAYEEAVGVEAGEGDGVLAPSAADLEDQRRAAALHGMNLRSAGAGS
jgi:hypothetical protein